MRGKIYERVSGKIFLTRAEKLSSMCGRERGGGERECKRGGTVERGRRNKKRERWRFVRKKEVVEDGFLAHEKIICRTCKRERERGRITPYEKRERGKRKERNKGGRREANRGRTMKKRERK